MYFSLFFVSIFCLRGITTANADALQYLNCTVPQKSECPVNSICTQLDENLFCICSKDFEWNVNWHTSSNVSVEYCRNLNATNPKVDSKLIIYIRSPARTENVALAILLVLVAATLATVVLYLIKVLKPIKRTKKVYMLLKRRRDNCHPLQEFDEIDLTWRDTGPQLFQ